MMTFRIPSRMKQWILMTLLTGVTVFPIALPKSSQAATYQVGDVVDNFTLYARLPLTIDDRTIPAGDPVHLHDFAGKILFIEFFFIW